MVINTVGVLVYMAVEAAVAKQKNRWGRVCQTIVFGAGMEAHERVLRGKSNTVCALLDGAPR